MLALKREVCRETVVPGKWIFTASINQIKAQFMLDSISNHLVSILSSLAEKPQVTEAFLLALIDNRYQVSKTAFSYF